MSQDQTTPATPAPDHDVEIVARAGTYYRNARYIIVLLFMAFGAWCIRDGFFAWPQANAAAFARELGLDPQEVARLSHAEILHRAKQPTIPADDDQPAQPKVKLPHPGWDVPMNRALGILLPPLALFVLLRTLYRSRGRYRLAGSRLYVPGHPPIPLDSIRKIDKRLWDRKGIAILDYELPSGQTGQFRLDDFVYQREPTDQIFQRIEAHVLAMADTPPA